MKYFPLPIEEESIDSRKRQALLHLTEDATRLILEICKNLKIPLECVHLAMWLFHCQVKLMTYYHFDRFYYLCGSILVATKISEHIRNPVDIIHQMRCILRRRKNITKEDSQQVLKRHVKKMFQAQVTIMINIGFDFDIQMGLDYFTKKILEANKIALTGSSDFVDKVKQTLTSFYQTQTVLYFEPQILCLAATDIVTKNQGMNLQLAGFSSQLIETLKNKTQDIRRVRSFYVNNCTV